YGCAVLVAVFGVAASRAAAREVHRIVVGRAGDVAGTPLRLVVLLGGYLVAAISVCDLVGLQLRQLLVGGAITGLIIGLAARPVLSPQSAPATTPAAGTPTTDARTDLLRGRRPGRFGGRVGGLGGALQADVARGVDHDRREAADQDPHPGQPRDVPETGDHADV